MLYFISDTITLSALASSSIIAYLVCAMNSICSNNVTMNARIASFILNRARIYFVVYNIDRTHGKIIYFTIFGFTRIEEKYFSSKGI